jgi:hypothetical protein
MTLWNKWHFMESETEVVQQSYQYNKFPCCITKCEFVGFLLLIFLKRLIYGQSWAEWLLHVIHLVCNFLFYIHGSIHHNCILIRSNNMLQYAGIYLLQNHSTCFGCPSHPSSGERKTVTAASGTGHSIW